MSEKKDKADVGDNQNYFWSELVKHRDSIREVDKILNKPLSDEELEQAYNEEMSDIMEYLECSPSASTGGDDSHGSNVSDESGVSDGKSAGQPAAEEKPKVDPARRRFEIMQEIRKENAEKHLGMGQSDIEKEARRRLVDEMDKGIVEDPSLRDYDPGEYLLNSNPDFYQPVIEGILNRNTINEINGDAGAGKTTLLVQMAVCLATGSPLFGAFRVARRGVSVFFTEDPDSVEMQVAAWSLRLGENMRDWIKVFRRPADLMEPAKLRIQKGRIMAFANGRPVNLVVFDSKMFHLSEANNKGLPMDENSNTDQQLITTAGHHFATNLKSAGIFIPHVSKGQMMSGNYNLESRGGSSAKGAVYKTFSLVRERVACGAGNKMSKDTGYTVFSVGKARQGGLKTNFKLKGIRIPVFSEDMMEKKRTQYEDCFEPGQDAGLPEFIKIDLSDHVYIFEDEVYDMDAGKDEEHFDKDEKRKSHTYTPLQRQIYAIVRSQPGNTMGQREIISTVLATVFKENGEPYSREGIRSSIQKLADLGHLKKSVVNDEPRNPYYTDASGGTGLLGSCAGDDEWHGGVKVS